MIFLNDAMKKFEGVYINTEYSGEGYTHPQKKVITSDGRYDDWVLATNTYPSWKGEYKMADSYMDSRGNTSYYHSNAILPGLLSPVGKLSYVVLLTGSNGTWSTTAARDPLGGMAPRIGIEL
jgi:hypothetical protein